MLDYGVALRRIKEGIARKEFDLEIDLTRPWGGYITLERNQICTPKILFVTDDLSIQSHELRDEVWVLLLGRAAAYRGPIRDTPQETVAGLEETIMDPGDIIYIPRRTVHAVTNAGGPAVIAELASGEAQEADIVRYYDKHMRGDKPVVLQGYEAGISIKNLIERCRERR